MRRAALLAALLASPAAGAETSADVLRRGPGARPHGLGGAFTAVADDAHAAAWNPAGLSLLRRQAAFASRYSFSGTNLESAGYGRPWRAGGLGAHATAAYGSRNAFKGGVAASTRLSHALHAGAGLSAAFATQAGRTASAALFDLGLLAAAVPGVNVGLTALNLSPSRLHGPAPEQWRLGTAVRFSNTDLERYSGLTASLELTYARFKRLGSANLGAEYEWRDWAFRLGVSAGHREQTEGRRVALGLGWRRKGLGLDYAFAPTRNYGDWHRLGATLEFGWARERPAADYLLRMESYESAEQEDVPASVHLIERRFTAAETKFQAGRPRLGLRELAHVKRLLPDGDPRLLRYYDAHGRGLLALQEWKLARESYVEAIQLARELKAKGPELGHLYAGLGQALAGEGRRAEALRFLQEALKEGTAPERRRSVEDALLRLKYIK